MQRVEGNMLDMSQTMHTMHLLLKTIDAKFDRLPITAGGHQRSTRSMVSSLGVKFSTVDEEIP